LSKVIERIGQATDVDRIHLFEIDVAASPDQGRILEHYTWSARGIPAPAVYRDATGTFLAEVGLGSWAARLARGETIAGHVRDFEDSVRRFFESGGLKSTVVVPIFVDDQWWGFIGFDDCRNEREWSPTEIDTLVTLAELVGAAVAHTSRRKSVADANQIIENSPSIPFRVGPLAPFPLVYLSQNISRYGYDADELLAMPERWPELIASRDLGTVIASIKAVAEGKVEQVRTEFRLKKPGGSHVWFDGEGRALRDERGRLIAVEGILTDVTERKHAESKLSFSHLLLTTAI